MKKLGTGERGFSLEYILYFVKKTAVSVINLFSGGPGILFQEFPLLRSNFFRDFNHNLNNLVSYSVTSDIRNPLPFDAQHLSGLSPGRDTQGHLARKGWDLNLSAKGGLHKAYRDLTKDIISLSDKEWMIPDSNHHIQVSMRPAVNASLPLLSQFEPGAGLHARGNI